MLQWLLHCCSSSRSAAAKQEKAVPHCVMRPTTPSSSSSSSSNSSSSSSNSSNSSSSRIEAMSTLSKHGCLGWGTCVVVLLPIRVKAGGRACVDWRLRQKG